MPISKKELAKMIDSTNVKATATKGEIENLCKEAVQYGFRCAVVNPVMLILLQDSWKARTLRFVQQ